MWILKLKVDSPPYGVGSFAARHGITITGYPLRYWKERNQLYALVAGQLIGPDKNKKEFLKDGVKQGLFRDIEVSGDFLIAVMRSQLISEPLYSPEVIWIKPAIISPDGYQIWELASWKKEPLQRIISLSHQFNDTLLKFVQDTVGEISLIGIRPELTMKQRKAFELAAQHGYYEYPRKIELKTLARAMHISYATYQAHLRKAERTLLPHLLTHLK